jgi:hypothetical protein
MGDRKTIQKYYPADFDPSLILRTRSGQSTKPTKVNFACPFRSMKCCSCGHYTTKGKVFRNSPKYISPDTYLGVKIVRLHCKCPDCRSEITIETDPKNMDYRIVSGAKREYEAWRNNERAKDTTEERLDRLEHEEAEAAKNDSKERTTMEDLEKKTESAKVEIKVADALDEIRAANARREIVEAKPPVDSFVACADAQEAQNAQIAQAAFKGKKRSSPEPSMEAFELDFSIARPAKKVKKDFAKALGIKRRS